MPSLSPCLTALQPNRYKTMLYSLLKPLIFALDAETAHETSLDLLNTFRFLIPNTHTPKPVKVMGLNFPNPLGLAAGLDKNADYLEGLSRFDFGFIEVGTVTPRAQAGNPQPRLFRVKQHRSIINRMGFNNKGVDYMLGNIKALPARKYILGINIGKNLTTAVDDALSDYRVALQQVYLAADYITVNISSPNTPGLRKLQTGQALRDLLKGISDCRKALQDEHQCQRPIALKVAPDIDSDEIKSISALLIEFGIDGLIATNTTLDRSYIKGHPLEHEAGGLSGAALTEKSRDILYRFKSELKDEIPIISAGGIESAEEAQLRLDLGANLIQIYSAFIYHGPALIHQIAKSITPR